MKKLLYFILKILSRKALKKYRPLVIAVTGSLGKTSAKDAIFAVLRGSKSVRRSQGNYNNELGVPLAVLGVDTGGRSVFKWLKVLAAAGGLIYFKKEYPEILILEMGAEKAGDINYLTGFVPVDIGVVTGISQVHLEFFGDLETVAQEKLSLFRKFEDQSKLAVVNLDDEKIRAKVGEIAGKVITYGFSDGADFRAGDFKITKQGEAFGTLFKLHFQEQTIPVFLPNIFGRQQVYACLPALAIGCSLGNKLLETVDDLAKYRPPQGRTNLIPGIKHTYLIDDSYNSSPAAAKAALEVLDQFPVEGRKIAVFGKMLELGSYQEEGHREVGKKAAEVNLAMLVAVGEMSRDIIRGAVEAGLPEERTFYFDNNHQAGIFVQNKLKENDLILIKGSQGARMEQIVKELMAEPLKARDLLVRQSDKWLAT